MWVKRGVGGYDGIYCTNTRLSTIKVVGGSGSFYLVLATCCPLKCEQKSVVNGEESICLCLRTFAKVPLHY
jgi:hypothetical protein